LSPSHPAEVLARPPVQSMDVEISKFAISVLALLIGGFILRRIG
jgi:hypothetical protein